MPFAQHFSSISMLIKKLVSSENFEIICRLGKQFEKSAKKIGTKTPILTPREREVAELIKQGFTNKQIAARLYISISTVKITISNIFDKMGIKSRVQLSDEKL